MQTSAIAITPILADFAEEKEAAAELRVTPRTMRNWAHMRVGPPRTKIGGKIYYNRQALRAWVIAQQEYTRGAA